MTPAERAFWRALHSDAERLAFERMTVAERGVLMTPPKKVRR